MFIDAMVLKIAKLLDKKETKLGGKVVPNLCFDYLLSNIPKEDIENKESKYYGILYNDGIFSATKLLVPFVNKFCGFNCKVVSWNEDNSLEGHLKQIKNKFHNFRDYRNKNLAHLDLYAAQYNKIYMPEDIFELIKFILDSIENLMNRIEVYYYDSNTCYELIIQNGANKLVSDLKKLSNINSN